MRWFWLAALAACGGSDDPTAGWVGNTGPAVHVVGHAFVFGPGGDGVTLTGATISIAELPEVSTIVTDTGDFAFDVPSGGPASFTLSQPGFHPNQSASLDVEADIPMLGFQAPTEDTVDFLANLVRVTPDPTKCQVATTVSRLGTAPYGGDGLGVDGATVTMDPMPDGALGPVYFAYNTTVPYPDKSLTMTSIDGGVVYVNVPVGEYTMTAAKDGATFSTVTIRCRAGVLVNAAPPNGIQQR